MPLQIGQLRLQGKPREITSSVRIAFHCVGANYKTSMMVAAHLDHQIHKYGLSVRRCDEIAVGHAANGRKTAQGAKTIIVKDYPVALFQVRLDMRSDLRLAPMPYVRALIPALR